MKLQNGTTTIIQRFTPLSRLRCRGLTRTIPLRREGNDLDNDERGRDRECSLYGCVDEVSIADQFGVQPVIPPVPR